MQALVDGFLLAESPDRDVIRMEGNSYFPSSSLTQGVLSELVGRDFSGYVAFDPGQVTII